MRDTQPSLSATPSPRATLRNVSQSWRHSRFSMTFPSPTTRSIAHFRTYGYLTRDCEESAAISLTSPRRTCSQKVMAKTSHLSRLPRRARQVWICDSSWKTVISGGLRLPALLERPLRVSGLEEPSKRPQRFGTRGVRRRPVVKNLDR